MVKIKNRSQIGNFYLVKKGLVFHGQPEHVWNHTAEMVVSAFSMLSLALIWVCLWQCVECEYLRRDHPACLD